MRDSMHILDQLRERGYEPQEDSGNGEQHFDRHCPDAVLRVILSDDPVRLVAFDRVAVLQWSARFTNGTPSSVILAALDAAEREASGQQGGIAGHYHDARGHEDTPCTCPNPGTYAPQPVKDGGSEDDEAAEAVARAWMSGGEE